MTGYEVAAQPIQLPAEALEALFHFLHEIRWAKDLVEVNLAAGTFYEYLEKVLIG